MFSLCDTCMTGYVYDFSAHCFSDLLLMVGQADMSVRQRYEVMYRQLVFALNSQTEQTDITFSGTFARLDYLCRQLNYRQHHPQAYAQLCHFRVRGSSLSHHSDGALAHSYPYDLRALCQFFAVLFAQSVPAALVQAMSPGYEHLAAKAYLSHYLRVSVSHIDADFIHVVDGQGESFRIPWLFADGQQSASVSLEYLRSMLKAGTQLNLVLPWLADGLLLAQHVIYEPDLLIDISSIARCYSAVGPSVYYHLLNRLDSSEHSSATLLGNFASQMLDEEVHLLGHEPATYHQSALRFFRDNGLSIASCADLQSVPDQQKFHQNARQQQLNLRQMVSAVFTQDRTIDLSQVVLEPSFYCEVLGLQGRMDLLQADKHVLMEQKSGKRDEYRHTHRSEHFVQVLLYQAMLHYAYRDAHGEPLRNDQIATYLLYSKYPDGLLKEIPAPQLLAEVLQLRNQMAHLEMLLAQGEARHILTHLTPDVFNPHHDHSRLWTDFIRPRLSQLLSVIQSASPLQQGYFFRMLTFVAREHLLSKVGTSVREASGFAALWNSTVSEKLEAGNILLGLTLLSVSDAHDVITLCISDTSSTVLPNFREGDIVVLYSYLHSQEPDARRDMVFRASIVSLSSDQITLRLRFPQKNVSLFTSGQGRLWAIEPDFIESSHTGLYRGLFMFLQASAHRQAVLLGQEPPRIDTCLTLRGDYGKFNDLVLRAVRAQDYFLLIGPPGTGKTSCGLVNILTETLLDPSASVLLVSYTNRAVDEICSKLQLMGVDYLRIGSDLSCSPDYRPHLLSKRVQQCQSAQEIRNLVQLTRVIVGTTASVSSHSSLFALKAFELCIIDEASQILEPHLLTILSARHGSADAIRRFVMIGDHKQLPAVVQQSERDSAVTEASLHDIGLLDCRQSLFERLLRLSSPQSCYMLSAQGRMHHDVAAFPNRAFYQSLLTEVPLGHQQRPIPFHTQSSDALKQLLCRQRVGFLSVCRDADASAGLSTSHKVNLSEARLIARIVNSVSELYAESGLEFSPLESVGIIVPYRHQIAVIRHELSLIHPDAFSSVTIDTVERFQGSQRDVIIYGFTISQEYQLSFLCNNRFLEDDHIIDRKLNVAMTRARESMILVGDPSVLGKDPIFGQLIEYSRMEI